MRSVSFQILAVLLVSISANAQQRKAFVSPDMAFSRELLARQTTQTQVGMPYNVSQSCFDSNKPVKLVLVDYNFGKDIRRIESLKKAAFQPYNFDALGRSPLPDASKDVMQQILMKSPR